MPARPLRGVVPAALLLACTAPPAGAAEYDIAIGPGNTYAPPAQAVLPGDTVRWAANTTHPLRFDGEPAEYTAQHARVLTAPGTLRFHCAVHGGPGGSGMSGVITIANRAPAIAVAVETAAPVAGRPVAFRATASDPDGQPLRIDWDLDGDGGYERTDAGATVSAAYAAGSHTARARAVDPAGASGEASVAFTVAAPAGPSRTVPADTTAPAVRVSVADTVRARKLRRRGVRIRITPSEDGTVAAALRDRRGRRLGRVTAPARAGEAVRLRIRARRARVGTLRLRVVAVDAAGNRAVVARGVRVTR